MNKKKIIITTSLVILFLIIILIFIFKKSSVKTVAPLKQTQKQTSDEVRKVPPENILSVTIAITSSPQIIKVTGDQIARETRKFIEGLKIGPGEYTTSLSCLAGSNNQGGNCQTTGVQSYIPGMLVSMYDEFYQQTKDNADQKAADQLMDELMVRCQKDTSFCEMIFFPLFGRYQKTKNPIYLSAMRRVGEEIFLPATAEQELQESINVFSLRIKKLLMIFSSTGNGKYLDKANKRLAQLETVSRKDENNYQVYKEGDNNFYKYDCQTHWTVDYQFYKSTGEKKYLDNLALFIDQINLDENYKKINDLVPLATCGEALISLYTETHEDKYMKTAKLLNQYAVKYFLDSNLVPKFSGDNGFVFNNFTITENNQTNTKTLTENIWLARNILKTSWNDKFEL